MTCRAGLEGGRI